MHYFTIRDVENLSGIKAHTLRIWEQRYGLSVGKRRESLHRYYDNEDLKHILRIAWLYNNGYRISHIATLSSEEISLLASKTYSNDEYEVLVNQLVGATLEYNQLQFEKILRSSMKTMGFEKSTERVIYPFFDKIGLLWLTDHLLPAHEHFCTFLIHKQMVASINALPPVTNDSSHRVLLFTPKGEMHDIPLLLMQYILKKQGVKTIVPGKNCSMETIEYCCKHNPVTHLYSHMITNFTNCDVNKYLKSYQPVFQNFK